MGRRVEGPDGREWVVRRRWAPRLGHESLWARFRRRTRGVGRRGRDLLDGADGAGCLLDVGDAVSAIAVVLVLVLLLLLAVLVVIPLLFAMVDVVLVLLVAGSSLVGRVVFRRPWTIEARAGDGTVRSWPVVGWRASGERRDEIAQLLAAGVTPPVS